MLPLLTIDDLQDALSLPTDGVLKTLQRAAGDVIVLGAGGKLGPTLSMMLRRGFDALGQSSRRVLAASRFSSSLTADSLRRAGVETICCDLTDRNALQNLPDVPNVIYLVGQKFGTRETPEVTWITNTLVPALVGQRFSNSRIVVLSTGCVYSLVPVDGPGSSEVDPLEPPGEYANSCVGRERVFTYFSQQNSTPMVFVRLCYAIDLRYGVLLDLARKIADGEPIDLATGATHVVWQGDANARIIQCLDHASCPPVAVNVTGRDRLSIRWLASRLGQLLGRDVTFIGQTAATAWLWNADRSYAWFGPPTVSIEEMLQATADWVKRGGETLDRPTHFEVRDGKF